MPTPEETRQQLETAIAGLEAQRAALGDAVVDPALRALREQLDRLAGGGPAAPADALQEERKNVTVMFADLSGFSDLARVTDPERTRALVNACFERLVPVIEAYGGTIDKFVGDAVVALFGAPVAHENDPERALRATLEMLEALESFNRESGTDLGLHFGVNTGRVVTGTVGGGGRGEYSAIGRPVNVAARLEGASRRGEVFVGLDTWRRTAPLFEFETLPPLLVQGEEEPIPVFRLLGTRAAPGSLRGLAGLESPLVGRDVELDRLRDALSRVNEGRGSRAVVAGEAGIGKSRLVAEARRAAGDEVSWVEARALAHTREASYAVARTLVRGLLGLPSDAGAERTAAALEGALGGAAPEHAAEHLPYLVRLLDLPLGPEVERALAGLAGEVLQRRIVAACVELVRASAAARPLAVVWEDAHWADPSSLRVLDALLPLPDAVPLVLLVVCRPEEPGMPELLQRLRGSFEDLAAVGLEPLSREASGRLLQNLVELDLLADETRARILERAEGNPFFLEEILRALVEQGMIVVSGGRALPGGPEVALRLPDTLEGVVASRIDRLAGDAKRVLQTASVIGRVFPDRLLERVVPPGSAPKVARHLEDLVERAFVRHRGDGSAALVEAAREYIFKHAITQEVAYETLLVERRRELHGRVGEAIESLWPDELAERSPILGWHFRRAGAVEKAVRYLALAGDRARATYANAEALGFYDAALELLDQELVTDTDGTAEWTVQLLEGRGDLLELGTRHDEARAAYERALAAAPGDPVGRSRLHRKVAATYESQRRFPEALETYAAAESALAASREDEAEAQRALIDVRLGQMWVHYVAGDVARMERELEAVRPVVERHATAAQRSLFFSRRANMASRRDRYVVSDDTVADVELALEAAHQTGNLVQIGSVQLLLGLMRWCRVDLEEAERDLQAALETTRRAGDVAWETRSAVYLAATFRRQGRVAEARELAGRSLAMSEAGGMAEYASAARGNLAWTALLEGEAAEALALGREAIESWTRHWPAYPFKWLAAWPTIAAALSTGDEPAAIEAARALLEPWQQAMEPAVERLLREAVARAERGEPAGELLARAVESARAARLL